MFDIRLKMRYNYDFLFSKDLLWKGNYASNFAEPLGSETDIFQTVEESLNLKKYPRKI